jgi:PilZ domain
MLTNVKTEPANDLRCAVRFPLRLPVALRANEEIQDGETQDISAGGVLIHCGVDYPVGSTISFSICMPGQTLGSDTDVQVECVGRVVRCAPAGDKMAVGAIIDEYRFSR